MLYNPYGKSITVSIIERLNIIILDILNCGRSIFYSVHEIFFMQ